MFLALPYAKSVGLAWTCQLAAGVTVAPSELGANDDVIVVPFISHSATAPESLRQSGATTVPADVTKLLLSMTPDRSMSHIARPTPGLRQRMSLTPLSLKSGGVESDTTTSCTLGADTIVP